VFRNARAARIGRTYRRPVRSAETAGVATWTDPAWRKDAVAWADEQLSAVGLRRDGEAEQPHVYPWSTALRLPLPAGGAVWLKSVGPGSAHEPPLSVALAGWAPDAVPVPLAVDADRRLMLLPDGGATMRDAGRATVAAWETMLRSYALLQLELAPHADEMIALGVPDHRPERLPGLVTDLLADDEAQLVGREGGLAPEVRRRITADLGRYAELCARLAGGGVPPTLQHDDLHDGNVFVSRGRHRFFDWGDASVGHPFLSLLVALRFAARTLDLPNGDPALLRLRDSYLEVWQAFGSPQELREQCTVALRVGPLQRALSWRRILRGVHPAELPEWQAAVPGWTAEHLEPSTLDPVGRRD
jgi:hypothetical protein